MALAIQLQVQAVPFEIDDEMDALLHDLNIGELNDFAETYEICTLYEEVKLGIFSHDLIFRRTGSITHLERAVQQARRWAESTSVGHPNRGQQLRILVQLIADITQHRLDMSSLDTITGIVNKEAGLLDDLSYAIESARAALDATPLDHPDRVNIFSNLGAWLGMRFHHAGSVQDLDEAIRTVNTTLQLLPKEHNDRVFVSINLGTWLGKKFDQTKSLQDLDKVIETWFDLLTTVPQDDPKRLLVWISHANSVGKRFELTGSSEDLQGFIEAGMAALDALPHDHIERPNLLINLASRLGMRSERTNSADDLDFAIEFAQAALDATPQHHPARSVAEQNLMVLGDIRFHQSTLRPSENLSTEKAKWSTRRLGFESCPSIRQICEVISTDVPSGALLFKGKCRVHWNILKYCDSELSNVCELPKAVTVTGTQLTAQADSCEEFVKRTWDSSAIVDLIVVFLSDPTKVLGPVTIYENTHVSIESVKDTDNRYPSTTFSLNGPPPEVARVVQQLAWITSAFEVPSPVSIATSTAIMEVSEPGFIDIRQQWVYPAPSRESCWHTLFQGAVLATGFPTSKREEGIGLEIPFELMAGLADIRTQIDVGNGATLLSGPGVVLYPTEVLRNGVQWHCARVENFKPTREYLNTMAETSSQELLELSKRRAFLGYYPQADVLLGTKDLVESNAAQDLRSTFQPTAPRIELANEGSFGGGLSIKGILSMTMTGKYVVPRTMRVSLQGRGYHDIVDQAERQPAIVYDQETKSAWLVSEASLVLHIALSFLSQPRTQERRQGGSETLQGNWPQLPYAEPCSDGGGEARRMCKEPSNCKIEFWAEREKRTMFSDVIMDILRDFRAIRDATIVQCSTSRVLPLPFMSTGLRGWEYFDLASRQGDVLQKEVPGDEYEASWWDLKNINGMLTILGSGFGNLIRPRPSSRYPLGLGRVPAGARLLIASKPCLDVLMGTTVKGGSPKLGPLEWRSNTGRSCFNNACDETSCICIQILRKRRPVLHDDTEAPTARVLKAQAVLFGESKFYHEALQLQREGGMLMNGLS